MTISEPAFRCSCPSRKFPCKHGLGLLLLLADQPALFKQQEPPAWVADWLAGHLLWHQVRIPAVMGGVRDRIVG